MSTDCCHQLTFWDLGSQQLTVDFQGGRVVSDAEWEAQVDSWLPSASDRAYVTSLMGRVVEPGKFANWIAPPVMGINRHPLDFEYVRFA